MKKIILCALILASSFSRTTYAVTEQEILELQQRIMDYIVEFNEAERKLERMKPTDPIATSEISSKKAIIQAVIPLAGLVGQSSRQLLSSHSDAAEKQRKIEALEARVSRLERKATKKVAQGKRRSHRRRA